MNRINVLKRQINYKLKKIKIRRRPVGFELLPEKFTLPQINSSIINNKAADNKTGKEITPIIAVTRNAQIVNGNLNIDIPLVLKLITVTI